MSAKYGRVYRSRVLGETSVTLLGPGGERAGAVRSDKAVFLHLGLGDGARPAVSARPDAARLRGTSAAPARAVGRLQGRTDAVVLCGPERRHRGARCGMVVEAGTDAVLSGDEADDAGPGRHVVPRLRHRTGGRRGHPVVHRHGRGRRHADPPALARHADGAAASRAASASSPTSRGRSRCGASAAARTCSRSSAARPTTMARCCRRRTSSTT